MLNTRAHAILYFLDRGLETFFIDWNFVTPQKLEAKLG